MSSKPHAFIQRWVCWQTFCHGGRSRGRLAPLAPSAFGVARYVEDLKRRTVLLGRIFCQVTAIFKA
jgi:hypothetical protein